MIVRSWLGAIRGWGYQPISISIDSRMDPDQAVEVLRSGLGRSQIGVADLQSSRPTSFQGRSSYSVLGSVDEQAMRLVLADRRFRSSFYGTFYGHLTPTAAGCELHGRIEFPRGAKTFMTIWLSLAVFMTVVSVVDPTAVSGNLPPWLFPILGIAFERLGLWIAHRSASMLTVWLKDRLRAAPESSERPSLTR